MKVEDREILREIELLYKQYRFGPETIYVRIIDHKKLPARAQGYAIASYMLANNIDGTPDFHSIKDGVVPIILNKTQIDKDKDEARRRELCEKVLELVKVELVTPDPVGKEQI